MPFSDPADKVRWRRENLIRQREYERRWREKLGPEGYRLKLQEYAANEKARPDYQSKQKEYSARYRAKKRAERIAAGWKPFDCVRLSPEEKARRIKERCRRRYLEERDWVFSILGGVCAHCGNDDPRVLEIDHRYGDGNAYRL